MSVNENSTEAAPNSADEVATRDLYLPLLVLVRSGTLPSVVATLGVMPQVFLLFADTIHP